jgi:hypothetical protein
MCLASTSSQHKTNFFGTHHEDAGPSFAWVEFLMFTEAATERIPLQVKEDRQ